jgi:hypothetical protein
MNGKAVVTNDRFEIKDLGEGKRQLVILEAEMDDSGSVSAKSPSNSGNKVPRRSWAISKCKKTREGHFRRSLPFFKETMFNLCR